MINIGNSSIENILVGDTQVDRVYLGTDVVWEHQQNDHDYVIIGGLKWATMNVGANNVTDTGLYFQWGDTQGYAASQVGTDKQFSWSDYKYTNDGGSTMTKYNSTDNKTVLDLSDDPANFNWGSDWRLPTKQEYAALKNATNYYWGNNNGVRGLYFVDKTDSSKELFFPASGYALDGIVGNVNTSGAYWSGSLDDTEMQKGDILYFYQGYDNFSYAANRRTGYNIRAVRTTNNS